MPLSQKLSLLSVMVALIFSTSAGGQTWSEGDLLIQRKKAEIDGPGFAATKLVFSTGFSLSYNAGTKTVTVTASGGGGSGTVTSVAIAGNDGLEVDSGSPITTSGTIQLGVNAATLKTHLSLGNVENTALSTWTGSTNLTTLGTIGTGTWQGTPIGDTYIASAATWNAKQPAGNYITALTGDVTATGPGSVAATIANDAVTNAKLANMVANTIKGRITASTGDPEDITIAGLTEETTPATGDFLLGWESGGGIRKFDIGDLPGGSGSSTFLGLTDAPSSYSGQSLKYVRVNAGETALEFASGSGGINDGDTIALGLTVNRSDTNPAFTIQKSGLGTDERVLWLYGADDDDDPVIRVTNGSAVASFTVTSRGSVGARNLTVSNSVVANEHLTSITSLADLPSAALNIYTNTAATSTVQQWSPTIRWGARGWKTDATAASRSVDFRALVATYSGAAAPLGEWTLQSRTGTILTDADYVTRFTVDTSGNVEALGTITGSNLSGTNTGDNATNSLYSGLVSNATHTGDATGATALTLATVNANVGSFGSATQVGTFTVNAKGLVTAASNTTITPAVGSITGLGTGVATALGVNIGTAGSFVVNGGALGTPSSGTLTNASGLPVAGVTMNTARLIGRTTASAGVAEEISIGTGLSMTAGVLSATGGGGGLTNITETLHTSSPNNTVNVEQLAVTGGTTNVDLVLTPKGSGAFLLRNVPDGTGAAGNKRGTYAVDLQMQTNTATNVASGSNSFLAGSYSRASGNHSMGMGQYNDVTGAHAFAAGSSIVLSNSQAFGMGGGHNVSGANSGAFGNTNTVTSAYSMAWGSYAAARIEGQTAFGANRISANGDRQMVECALYANTSDATTTEMFAGIAINQRYLLTSNRTLAATVTILAQETGAADQAMFIRQVCITNDGGTTALVGSVVTIGTDQATAGAGTWAVAISANDTQDAIKIEVTGQAATNIRWIARISGVEILY